MTEPRWTPGVVALTALAALTGGFGLLVPRIHGLAGCGDFYCGRVLWCVPIALSLAFLGLVARGVRSTPGQLVAVAPLVFCASVAVNLAGGRDPLAAWLDWRVTRVDWASLDPGTESAGCYFIENHEHVSYDPVGDLYRAQGV